ncbi:MAG: hypothetical protein L0Y72_23955 [Gemmataceae bacterium]|nr:hypothetical protein [Gemmataceae bacterium]MCI0742100.1 hypothetical protein [Gemmataceae bacterium]
MQVKKVVDPFGEVNVYPTNRGAVRVTATILMEPRKESTQTGIALDGSSSMRVLYGLGPTKINQVTPVAQRICAYLASKIDADGGTTVIYWATGLRGDQVEVIGDLRAEEAERHNFGPPREYGTDTRLVPAVKYFVERFADAPWGFYVFITDGSLNDMGPLKSYTTQLAREIAAGKRNPLKFVLIGVGDAVDEEQMEALDDLYTGTNIDLWDHRIAREMRVLQEIFAEVVDQHARVADNGKILDAQGTLIKDYAGVGLPAFLEFEVPAGSESFVLEVNGQQIRQEIPDPRIKPAPPIPKISSRRPEPTPPSPKRGCFSLLAGLLILIVALWWTGRARSDEESAAKALAKLGAEVFRHPLRPGKPLFRVDFSPKAKNQGLKELRQLKDLEYLEIGGPFVDDAYLREVKQLTQLQRLGLSLPKVSVAGIKELKALKKLEELYLNGPWLTDALAKELGDFRQLRGLALTSSRLGDAGLAQIKGLTQLESLNVSISPISDAGLEEIKDWKGLRTLNLRATRISDAALGRIKQFKELTYLDISQTEVSDASLKDLIEMTQLESLHLTLCKITEKGWRQLRAALPKCKIIEP